MGEVDEEQRKKIRKVLARRRLKPDFTFEWEVHGPHKEMNYEVYVGLAYTEDKNRWVYVAIYPWAVYEIDDIGDWYLRNPKKRIFVV